MAERSASNLPSDVVEDADFDCVDARVPTLGLHLPYHEQLLGKVDDFPWEKRQQDSSACPWEKKRDSTTSSRCDSGICDSVGYLSSASSIRSSYGEPTIPEEGNVSSLRDQLQALTFSSDLRLPHNRHAGTHIARIPSVDEGFDSEPIISDISEEKPFQIVFPPEHDTSLQALQEIEAIDDRILDIFVQDEDGDTKLHMAIIQLQPDVAEQMLRLCPDVSLLCLQNTLGQTPLHLAVITKQVPLVRGLMMMGAPLEQRDRHGNTALHIACREGSVACVKALTEGFSAIEAVQPSVQAIPQNLELWNYDGETCLHMALLRGHWAIILYLTSLALPANIDAKDGRSGRTVLHYAVESGSLNLIQFLIKQCRANPNASTFDGSTPFKLAHGRNFQGVQKLLIECGASLPSEGSTSDESDFSSDSDDDMDISAK